MAEVWLAQPVPARQPHDPAGTDEIGFIFDDVTRRIVGLYGENTGVDHLRYEVEVGADSFRLDLPAGSSRQLRLPARARLRERVRPASPDPLTGRLRPERRTIPYIRLVCERVYANPRGASPTVLSVTSTSFNSDATSHACGLPATVDADDGLLIVFGMSNVDFGENLMAAPAGFTEKFDDQWDNSGERQGIGVFIKVADGSEDGGTANVTTGTATAGSSHVYRIDAGTWGESTDSVEVSAKAEGDSSNADPPLLTPSGGSADYLWIAAGCKDDTTTGASAAPTDFTNLTNTSGDDSEASALFTARRGLEASSLDPGTFTSASEKWITVTMSVAPAADEGTLHEATAASSVSVTGAATGKKTGKATATTSATVTGTATGKKTGKATATTSVTVTGAAAAHAVRKGTASTTVTVTGSAAGKSQPQRTAATTSITVTGTATGKKTAKATAASNITVSGSAVGKKTGKGTAAAEVTVTGSASAQLPAPAETATADSLIRITTTAAGKKRQHRTGTVQLAVTASAAGKATRKATATVSVTVTTTGRGWVPREHDTGLSHLVVTADPYGLLDLEEV